MSHASKISAAITAIANALNARNAPGPSAYQMWLAAGNTGTIDQFNQYLVGLDLDYAAYLDSLLTTPPVSGAATEAKAGITQFATPAEVQAGTIGTKAVSALRLLASLSHNLVLPTSGARSGLLTPENLNVTNGDWNTVIATGFYEGSAMANAPGGNGGWNWVTVQRFADNWVSQVAHTFTVTGAGQTAVVGARYQRMQNNGVWGQWQRIADDATSVPYERGGLNNTTSWNTLVTPGIYLFNGGTGNPTGFPSGAYNYGHLLVLRAGSGVSQQYMPDGTRGLYVRHAFSGVANGFGTGWNYLTGTIVAAT